jgi:hypothetical protein
MTREGLAYRQALVLAQRAYRWLMVTLTAAL